MRSCSISWIESLLRPRIDYAARRQTERKDDASDGRTMFLTLWTAVKVEYVVKSTRMLQSSWLVHWILRTTNAKHGTTSHGLVTYIRNTSKKKHAVFCLYDTISTASSPLLLDVQVQRQEARHSERHSEYSQQPNVWPPEGLQTHHASTWVHRKRSKTTYLCTQTEYRQNRGSGHI